MSTQTEEWDRKEFYACLKERLYTLLAILVFSGGPFVLLWGIGRAPVEG